MVNYRISPSAKADLERIWFYVEHWEAEAADSYYKAFFDHFKEFVEQPLLYAVSDVRKGYRRSICGKDSVFYRINGHTVEIMAIIGQQDVNEWL